MASEPRNYPDYVFVAYDEDFSAQTYDIAVSLEPGNLVGRPVKYIRHDLNTRPAPAATNTGLVTVAKQWKVTAKNWSGLKPEISEPFDERELVTRSQAAELLAAERAAQQRLLDIIEEANDDKEALEAKLAAAEKALEPFVSFFNEAMKGFTEGYAERTPPDKPVLGWNNAYLLMRHFIEARAVLGGKP